MEHINMGKGQIFKTILDTTKKMILIPFFPTLGAVHLPPSTTKTFHIIKTSWVKPSISSSPA